MPLTFGGGIRILSDVDERIKNGADKVTINTAAFQNQSLITDISKKYGAQCVVVSIDYRMIDNKPIVFINNGT
ncbi:HisA/HisF-related TIM barrel protein, partial [Klebsiella pneumoniae]|uniref:HisA/HisF-related TIM barrel protein n=1 Tax=Klebsiella pneumoniae TaxID=573 RepID=UPI003853EB73